MKEFNKPADLLKQKQDFWDGIIYRENIVGQKLGARNKWHRHKAYFHSYFGLWSSCNGLISYSNFN
jgi:hypothetical protein